MPAANDITRLRRERDAALAVAFAADKRLREFDDALAAARRRGDRQALERLAAERAQAERAASDARRESDRAREQAIARLGDLLERTPQDIVGTLSDRHPFVLLPV